MTVNNLHSFLSSKKIESVIKSAGSKGLIDFDIEKQNTLEYALRLMEDFNIQSIPVYHLVDDAKAYVGILSIQDILAKTVFQPMFDLIEKGKGTADETDIIKEYFLTPISGLLGTSLEGQRWFVDSSDSSVSSLFSSFAKDHSHRMLVKDAATANQEMRVLTQKDLISWLKTDAISEFSQSLGEKTAADVNELSRRSQFEGKIHVFKFQAEAPALGCFRAMFLNGVNAIALINENGKIVDQISVTDLRSVTSKGTLDDLLLPATTYLELVRGKTADLVTCSLDTKVTEIVELLVSKGVHRVWIVEDDKVVGVVSCSDIIELVAQCK